MAAKAVEAKAGAARAGAPGARGVAVIDIGTTAVRMVIAEIAADGTARQLETLQQAVSLGKDTFTRGAIERETAEACVKVLRSFVRVLDEYGVRSPDDVRAVATSAVREADNRDAFLDRVFVATGMDVRILDEAEVNRYTYLAVQPLLRADARLRKGDAFVVEVGGGSTEALLFRGGRVAGSHTYRLGSLRLRQMMAEYRFPMERLMGIVQNQIDRTIKRALEGVPTDGSLRVLALGGDARFACARMDPEWDRAGAGTLKAASLSRLADQTLGMSVDELVRRFHVTYPEAETLGPALLVFARLVRALNVGSIRVGTATLRDGVLAELASGDAWTAEFREQVLSSAMEIGAKYRFDRDHAENVADLSLALFRALRNEHRLGARWELILATAALLHEIGAFVSNRSHHKHSQYLILNSDIFGLGSRDLLLTALVARYHRRSPPQATHEEYSSLDREGRGGVSKLAAILRVADALCRRPGRRRRELDLAVGGGTLTVGLEKGGDMALYRHGLREKGAMFEQVYGMNVALRSAGEDRPGA